MKNSGEIGKNFMVIGPTGAELDRATAIISMALADRIGNIWDEWYGRLVAYHAQEGNCRVPALYKDKDGYALGEWVDRQRQLKKKGKLAPDRIKRLDALGFEWEAQKS